LISDSKEKLHCSQFEKMPASGSGAFTLVLSLVRMSEWTVSACVWPSAVWALLRGLHCGVLQSPWWQQGY